MKSNLAIMTLKALLAISAVTTFVACSSNAQTRSPAGTQDVGGGNGLTEGKIYEAYIVDVTTLPAFQKYVKPIFAKLNDENVTEGNGFESLVKIKNWYLAPMSLKPLSKSGIGFSVSDTKNVQYAVQTKDKVVIDKNLFDKMNMEEQARLITHEMVMSMYLVKYMTINEINEAVCRGGGACQERMQENWEGYIEYKWKPLPYKALDRNDYEHIRSVTAWLFANAPKSHVTRAQVYRILYAHKFDKRFFSSRTTEQKKILHIDNTAETQLKSFVRGQALGTLPTICYGVKTGIKFECSISVKRSNDLIWNGDSRVIVSGIETTLNSAQVNRTILSYYGSKSEVETNSLSLEMSPLLLWGQHLPSSCEIGQRMDQFWTTYSTQEDIFTDSFDANKASWDLDTVVFMPNVITSIEKSADRVEGNTTYYGGIFAKMGTPRVTSLENDLIIATNDESKVEEARLFVEGIFAQVKNFSNSCMTAMPK